MKKMIFSVLTLTVIALTTNNGYAQDKAPAIPAGQEVPASQEPRVKVEVNALPEGVKKLLASDAYKEWTASAAWQVKAEAGEYYIVELKKGDETTSLKVDANGNPVK